MPNQTTSQLRARALQCLYDTIVAELRTDENLINQGLDSWKILNSRSAEMLWKQVQLA